MFGWNLEANKQVASYLIARTHQLESSTIKVVPKSSTEQRSQLFLSARIVEHPDRILQAFNATLISHLHTSQHLIPPKHLLYSSVSSLAYHPARKSEPGWYLQAKNSSGAHATQRPNHELIWTPMQPRKNSANAATFWRRNDNRISTRRSADFAPNVPQEQRWSRRRTSQPSGIRSRRP